MLFTNVYVSKLVTVKKVQNKVLVPGACDFPHSILQKVLGVISAKEI